jgi:hypothetical protein
MANFFDADPIDRNLASVRAGLHVLDGNHLCRSWLKNAAHGVSIRIKGYLCHPLQ